MGINRFVLGKSAKQGTWQGMAILPVCVSGRNDWRVSLYLVTKQASFTAIYNLNIEN